MSWTKIEEVTLSSSQASVTLGNGGTIPQGYKTLKLIVSARSDASAVGVNMQLRPNGSTANLSDRYLDGNGATAASGSEATVLWCGNATAATATANTFANDEITIPNYAGSTNKPVSIDSVTENNATTAYQDLIAGLWSNTAAITSLTVVSASGSFVSGSTFTLYGLN